MGKTINQEIISVLESSGVSPKFVSEYKDKVRPDVNDLNFLGNWWAQHIAGLYLIEQPVTNICIYLRDTRTLPSWMGRFKQDVAPLIRGVYNGQPESIY